MKRLFFIVAFISLFISLAFGQNTGGVKGKVRTTKGEAINGVKITARQKGEDIKSAQTDRKGEFVLDGLKPGLYNLVFEKSGYSSGVLYNIEVRKNKTDSLDDRLVLGVDQGTLVIIKGSVFNQHGRSVSGAKVEIEKISGDGSVRKMDSETTSMSGEFTFRFPEAAAKYRVTASADGAKASKEIEVETAAIYRLAITLDLLKEN